MNTNKMAASVADLRQRVVFCQFGNFTGVRIFTANTHKRRVVSRKRILHGKSVVFEQIDQFF